MSNWHGSHHFVGLTSHALLRTFDINKYRVLIITKPKLVGFLHRGGTLQTRGRDFNMTACKLGLCTTLRSKLVHLS